MNKLKIPLIVANWKMHKNFQEATNFINFIKQNTKNLKDREIAICPAYVYLKPLSQITEHIKLGAQNLHWEQKGAFTGEVSADMLKDVGCHYVIIGHSERRQYFFETDDLINKKIKIALKFELFPIFCIGETLNQRQNNETFNVIENQLTEGLKNLTSNDVLKITIAYEPVWAIGTGQTATPQQAQEVHSFIRQILKKLYFDETVSQKIRILYGGSIKPDNIDSLMNMEDIDGGLVGGASIEENSFLRIINFK